jgi:hypothetical protein
VQVQVQVQVPVPVPAAPTLVQKVRVVSAQQ